MLKRSQSTRCAISGIENLSHFSYDVNQVNGVWHDKEIRGPSDRGEKHNISIQTAVKIMQGVVGHQDFDF